MAPEGDSLGSYILEAEGLGDIVRAAVIEPAAPEDPAESQTGTLDYAESHHRLVEILGAGGAVDAVSAQERRDQFLVAFHRQKEDFPCNVFPHVVKISSGRLLFNTSGCKGLTKHLVLFYITSVIV